MKVRKLTIRQASELLSNNERQKRGLDIRIAETHHAPGGGEMITYNSRLTPSALQFIARRKRTLDAQVSVVIYEPGDDPERKAYRDPAALPCELAEDEAQGDNEQRARVTTRKVARAARRVARHADQVHQALIGPQLKTQDFTRPEVKQALSVFGIALRRFRKNTENAIEEYIEHGNTLIMDLITQYELDVVSLKHALKVACFATELVSMMGEDAYFGDEDPDTILGALGEPLPEQVTDAVLKEKKQQLFKRELVEIFLGGFMHDAGLWQVGLQDGHEIRGAMTVAHTPSIETISESLVDLVLFHSDVRELAANGGVLRVFGLSQAGDVVSFQREYFKRTEDIHIAENLKKKSFAYRIFSESDLRKIMPIAISEAFISQTQSRKPVPKYQAITELVSYCEGGLYQKLMVTMCNMQTDVIAPKRAMVTLEGNISVNRDDMPRWLNMTGSSAISVGHDDTRHAPHLITVFSREEDGSQKILSYLSSKDQKLWDRADPDSRMYVPGGRYRSLSHKVVAILRKDIFEKHFSGYERGVQERIQAAIIF